VLIDLKSEISTKSNQHVEQCIQSTSEKEIEGRKREERSQVGPEKDREMIDMINTHIPIQNQSPFPKYLHIASRK
tara:strand:+ start:389 stop:613 length:225 start_codon:yes stop_codon:yes gene_type:complete